MLSKWEIFFYSFFSSISFASATLAIFSKNPIHCVFFLILVFVNMAGFLLVSEIEFLSLMLIIIYVGAIAVLFLFVVMMLDISYIKQKKNEDLNYTPLIILLISTFLLETFLVFSKTFLPYHNKLKDLFSEDLIYYYSDSWRNFVINFNYNPWFNKIDSITNTETIGQVLYTYYAIFFLIAGIILLIALIGAVSLTIRKKKKFKQQTINKQIMRSRFHAIFHVK